MSPRNPLLALALAVAACASPTSSEPEAETTGEIVSGKQEHDAPASGYLRIFTPAGSELRCGGTIVTERLVISAAHCFTDGVSAAAFGFGKVNTDDHEVTAVLVHPSYVAGQQPPSGHDIAAVVLSQPIAAKYASIGQVPDNGFKGIAVGYGVTTKDFQEGQTEDAKISDTLKSAKMQISAHEPGRFQADGVTGSGCAGDSGSAFYDTDKHTLLGIQSFGARPCTKKGFNVFTNVFSELDFVQATARCAAQADVRTCLAALLPKNK